MSQEETHDWQQLAPLALLFLVLAGIQKFIRENLFLILGAGAGAAFLDWMGLRELLLGGIGVLLIILIVALIYHRRFRFCMVDDAILVRSGLIHRKELRVRFARVQNVQLGQPFYFRPFDLVRFSLETPGAAQKEVELPGIRRELAETLRDRISGLQDARPASLDGEGEPAPAQAQAGGAKSAGALMYRASPGALFRYGMASNQLWVLLGFMGYLLSNLFQRFSETLEDLTLVESLIGTLGSGWMLGILGVGLLMVFLLGLSGLIAVVRFHDFTLIDRQERIVARAGLLETKEQTLRREKITGLTFRQTPLGRLWGSWFIKLRQTGNAEQELAGQKHQLIVPGLRWSERDLAGRILDGWSLPEGFDRIHRRFLAFYWSRGLLIALIPIASARWLSFVPEFVAWAGGGLLMVATGAVALRYRNWGLASDGRMLWVRSGLLGRSVDIVELAGVQQVRLVQNWYQRRHQLADLELVMPQGSVVVPFLPAEKARGMANLAVFAAETASIHRV